MIRKRKKKSGNSLNRSFKYVYRKKSFLNNGKKKIKCKKLEGIQGTICCTLAVLFGFVSLELSRRNHVSRAYFCLCIKSNCQGLKAGTNINTFLSEDESIARNMFRAGFIYLVESLLFQSVS